MTTKPQTIKDLLQPMNVKSSLVMGNMFPQNKTLTGDFYTCLEFLLSKWELPSDNTEICKELWGEQIKIAEQKTITLQPLLPSLIKQASEYAKTHAERYTRQYGVRDLTGELYSLAIDRLGRNWFPPNDTLEGITKAWGTYMYSSFKHVISTELKDDVIPKCYRDGKVIPLMKQFEDGFPEWLEMEYKPYDHKGVGEIITLLKKNLTVVEFAILSMRSGIQVEVMTLDSIADWFNSTPAFRNLGMTKGKVNLHLRTAKKKAKMAIMKDEAVCEQVSDYFSK